MAKKRIYTIAKENSVENQAVLDAAAKLNIDVKNHMSSVDEDAEKKIISTLKGGNNSAAPEKAKKAVKSDEKSTAAKPASSDSNKSSEKTKIKISAVRRDPNKNKTNKFNNNNSRNNSNGQRPNNRRPNNNNNSGRPNNNNNNRRNNNISSQQQAPRPRQGGAGAKYLDQFKTDMQSASRTPERSTNNNQSRRNNNTSRPTNNAGSNNRPANNVNRDKKPVTNNNQKPVQNSAANKPNVEIPKEAFSAAPSNGPAENTRGKKPVNRNFDNKQNLGNPYGSRKKKKNRKKQQQQRNNEPKKVMPQRKERPLPETLVYTVGMNAQDLGKILHREPAEIVKKVFMLGMMINQNQSLDKDTIELIAEDYGIQSEEKVQEDIADIDQFYEEEIKNSENTVPRPPVVTIMGHVDHGKTTLLDNLRNSHITDSEAGGITQHIGAYQVRLSDRLITFLDTPGHAAFTNMRARGADVTDIVVLVVAADDGVMPQTIEAINHAKAAGDPIIVAVNKIDKPGANPQHVIDQLMEYELIPEEYGGDTIFVQISAKQDINIDQLLEMILLQADVLELKADPDQKAVGTVIEAKLDKGRGPVASLLVQQGTLHVGDPIVVGNTFGRVRTMTDYQGKEITEALPSQPIEITGLNDVPESADKFVVFEDEKTARAAGEERANRALQVERQKTNPVTLDNLFETMQEGDLKKVDVIIKADVQGSAEAIAGSLKKIDVEGVRVNIIHQAVGAITESDINLAAASNAIVIGFNVRPTAQAKLQATEDNVDIRLHRVIYQAIDEIEAAMKGMLEPVYEEKITGNLTVRETYNVSKIGTIAGCIVDNGYINRESGVRLVRDGVVIYEGKLASLKRFKDDVKEVKAGFECGVTIENYNDIKIADQIEAYVMEEVPVK
ncbi:translation initiation factor IF-2 [Companilactobacillus metriopterae]|uniref:translation initiation factor IF-2 n=1 Tax=Companilactobacillus metriopterae TaxID=1909267 RepID=UPI00100BF668|nr:translation initiation factor IF-2 [Companilactobacillus metriopterae]